MLKTSSRICNIRFDMFFSFAELYICILEFFILVYTIYSDIEQVILMLAVELCDCACVEGW